MFFFALGLLFLVYGVVKMMGIDQRLISFWPGKCYCNKEKLEESLFYI